MKIKKIIIALSLLYTSLKCEKTVPSNSSHECTHQSNKQFTLCVTSLPEEEQKEIVKSLNEQQRKEFIRFLSLHAYNEWLDNYNEYDWTKLYNNLTPEEQAHWPTSVAEQRIAILLIYVDIIVKDGVYEEIASTIDIIPFAKTVRKKIEHLCFGEPSIQERVEKKFNKYKREKFNV